MSIDLTGLGQGNGMDSQEALGWLLAYLGLLGWMCAGLLDFRCHRRTDLPHTSGLVESSLHLLQLALVGAAIVLGMLFEFHMPVIATMTALVAVHACVGYLDTRQAFRHRPILPFEQHIHSVLDMAPWIGLGLVIAATWPAAVSTEWTLALRQPGLPAWVWLLVLAPAALLCGLPAAAEWRAAWLARHEPPRRDG
ncbi:hypothetical protein [Luteimonas sp. SDU82]|uniref:hypothetical protein n=1 Tax=Luteimonas sp. SDU82 TaxID=3422592 RepID=UPI003EBD2375